MSAPSLSSPPPTQATSNRVGKHKLRFHDPQKCTKLKHGNKKLVKETLTFGKKKPLKYLYIFDEVDAGSHGQFTSSQNRVNIWLAEETELFLFVCFFSFNKINLNKSHKSCVTKFNQNNC